MPVPIVCPMSDADTADIGRMAVQAVDLMRGAVGQIPTSSWDAPSNLAGWSVRDLVAHATGSATKIVMLVEGGELWDGPSKPSDWTYDDPEAQLGTLGVRLRDALSTADLDTVRASPEGEVPVRRALMYPVSDLALHSWDVHRSLGARIDVPGDLLALCDSLVTSVPEAMLRRPGGFGPAQPVSSESSPTDRLMAFLGRSVADES